MAELGGTCRVRLRSGLDDYLGLLFEDVAREHARQLAASGELEADRVSGWWSADGRFEIDLVGLSGRQVSFVGEAKWSQRAIRREVLTRLDIHRQGLGRAVASPLACCTGGPNLSERRVGRLVVSGGLAAVQQAERDPIAGWQQAIGRLKDATHWN